MICKWIAALAIALAPMQALAESQPLKVFAAASLTDALDALLAAYEAETGRKAVGVYAASGALARQVDAGAPADIFISAHAEWTAWLEGRGALGGPTSPFAGNVLVIAALEPLGDAEGPDILMRAERIAVADLRAAPAGRYAHEALLALGVFERLRGRLIEGADARAAAAWVARGEADVGVFYATDADAAGLLVLYRFEPNTHAPIIYQLALVAGAHADAADLRAFLLSPSAQAILTEHGFALRKQ